MSRLAVNLAGLSLRNPIIAASGTCGYIDELADATDLRSVGALTTKSITRLPRAGNPTWRIVDMPAGMLNAIGLANVGLDAFLADKLPRAERLETPIIGSIAGDSIDDYVAVAEAFDAAAHLAAVEINVSCPNTADGLIFGEHPDSLRELLSALRPALARKKMFVKLSPNVGDITALAHAAVDCRADGLTLINTVRAMAIDVESRRPRISRGVGGYSGPAIHPIAVRMVHEVYRAVARESNVPIIGLGGVMSWRDAAELILAGASAVGVGTALFANPRAPRRINHGLGLWVERQGAANISQLVGKVELMQS